MHPRLFLKAGGDFWTVFHENWIVFLFQFLKRKKKENTILDQSNHFTGTRPIILRLCLLLPSIIEANLYPETNFLNWDYCLEVSASLRL